MRLPISGRRVAGMPVGPSVRLPHSFSDLEGDVRQSLRRIAASPFMTKRDSLRGFIFDVATGRLNEVTF